MKYKYGDKVYKHTDLSTMFWSAATTVWETQILPIYEAQTGEKEKDWFIFYARAKSVINLLKFAKSEAESHHRYLLGDIYSALIEIKETIFIHGVWFNVTIFGKSKVNRISDDVLEDYKNKILECHKSWNQIDSKHEIPTEEEIEQKLTHPVDDSSFCACLCVILTIILGIILGMME